MIQSKRLFVLIALAFAGTASFAQSPNAGGLANSNGINSANNAGINPHAISLYNLGLNAYKQGSPESAIIFFKRAVDLDPDLADAQYNLGVLYQSERRLKEAVPRFKEALRVKPEDADSHYQLGLVLIDLGQFPEARQNLEAIAPNSAHFTDAQKKVAYIDSQMNTANNSSNSAGTNDVAGIQSTNNSGLSAATSAGNQNMGNSPISAGNSGQGTANAGQSAGNTISSSNTVNANTTNNSNTNATKESTESAVSTSSTQQGSPATVAAAANSPSNPVALIDNASVQVVANGFAAPSGLTFDRQGNLYIANFVTSTIDCLAPDGKRSQFSTGINLKGPIGLICDDDNNIYVANYLAGTITRINPAGIAQIIVSGLKKPYYLAMDKQGNLFVSEQEDNTIVRISLSHNSISADAAQPPTSN